MNVKFRKSLIGLIASLMLVSNVTYAEESESVGVGSGHSLDSGALEASFSASQFVAPFGNSMYNVLTDDAIKSSLPELYDSDGKMHELRYTPLLKDKSGSVAKVKDVLAMGASNTPTEYYIKYEFEVETDTGEEDDDGNAIIETSIETDYQMVYYNNPYTLMYLTLFLSNDSNAAEIADSSMNLELMVDQYGNIVVDGSKTLNKEALMVVPNIANPALNGDEKWFLPSRKLVSVFDTSLNGVSGAGKLSSDKFNSLVGKKQMRYDVGIYNLNSEYFADKIGIGSIVGHESRGGYFSSSTEWIQTKYERGGKGSKASSYLVGAYQNFLGMSSSGSSVQEDYLLFTFGSGYENKIMNNIQSEGLYSGISILGTTGVGKKNFSMGILPTSGVYFGDSTKYFSMNSIDLESKNLIGSNSVSRLEIVEGNFFDVLPTVMVNNECSWSGKFTDAEVGMVRLLTSSYASSYNTDLFTKLVEDVPADDIREGEGDPTDSLIKKPEDLYDQKVNTLVDGFFDYVVNPGTTSKKMRSSNLSSTYKDISSAFNSNYLFQFGDVLNDPMVNSIVKYYCTFVVLINTFLLLIMMFRSVGKQAGELVETLWRSGFLIGLSLLPVLAIFVFTWIGNTITAYTLDSTYLYWNTLHLEGENTLSSDATSILQEKNNLFRELNILDNKGKAELNMYTGIGDEVEAITVSTLNSMSLIDTSDNLPENIFFNRGKYYRSVFFYFYDVYRYHYYNYYIDTIATDTSWKNEDGLLDTRRRFIGMVTDPSFLYGTSYSEEDGLSNAEVQDILMLSNLFSDAELGEVPNINAYVQHQFWYENIMSRSNLSRLEEMPNSLPSGSIVYGSALVAKNNRKDKLTQFELKLDSINRNVVKELIKLSDYSDCKDETLLMSAALLSTIEFNKAFNSTMLPQHYLQPYTFNSSSYSFDTILRSLYMDSIDDSGLFSGDIIANVEGKGGLFAQLAIIGTLFICGIGGFVTYLVVLCVFLFALYVFFKAYVYSYNFKNKSWLGLLFYCGCNLGVHFLFLWLLRLLCVPDYAVLDSNMFSSLMGVMKNIAVLTLVCIRIFIAFFLFKFAISNPVDLGGSIVADKVSGVWNNVHGRFEGVAELFSDIFGSSEKVELKADGVETSGGVQTEDSSGTVESGVLNSPSSLGESSLDVDTSVDVGGESELYNDMMATYVSNDTYLNDYSQSMMNSTSNEYSPSTSQSTGYNQTQSNLQNNGGSVSYGGTSAIDNISNTSGGTSITQSSVSDSSIKQTTIGDSGVTKSVEGTKTSSVESTQSGVDSNNITNVSSKQVVSSKSVSGSSGGNFNRVDIVESVGSAATKTSEFNVNITKDNSGSSNVEKSSTMSALEDLINVMKDYK